MKVSTAIKYLSELDPGEEIVINWFSKSTYEEYYNDEDPVDEDKWISLVNYLDKAEQFWQNNHYAIEAEVNNWLDLQEDKEEENE